jgi:flagellar protein FliL
MADTASQQAVPDDTETAKPAGLKAKLPMIALVAVGLAVGGGTGAKFIGPMVAGMMGRGSSAPKDTTAHEGKAEADAKEHDSAEAAKSSAPSVLLLENLVLNPAGSGGSRFLLLSVGIETSSANTTTEFQARDSELRDIILTALGSKTVDNLTDISARESIKAELQAAIAVRFGKGAAKRLYFPQFVVQ